MTKVAFVAVDARFTHSNPAIRSILAWCREYVPKEYLPDIVFLEHNINQNFNYLLGELYAAQADAYFFSAYIWNIELLKPLIIELRQVCPDALIGMGGPEVAFTPTESLADMASIDLVFTGEGEQAFAKLLPFLKNIEVDGNYRDVALKAIVESPTNTELIGVTVRNREGGYAIFPSTENIDLDQLPFLYSENFTGMKHRYVYYESSRGCPFHCTYCLSANDDQLRFRSVENTLADLDRFIEAEIPLVKFIDRSFNANPERARKVWAHLIATTKNNIKALEKQKLGLLKRYEQGKSEFPPYTRFHFEIEARLLTETDFEILATAPPDLFQFEVGIQTFNPDVLTLIRRSTDTESILISLQRLHELGNIHCHADLIFGLPGQDINSIARSFRLILSSHAEKIQLGFLKVLKGTPMMLDAKMRSFRWQNRAPYEILSSDKLSFAQILKLKHLEEVFERFWDYDLFPRSMALIKKLNLTRSQADEQFFLKHKELDSTTNKKLPHVCFDAFRFFLIAGEYFYDHGYLDRSLSQNEFFSRLYDFVKITAILEPKTRTELTQTIKDDYINLPRGGFGSFEKLREIYT